jgi:DNA polymerase
MTRPEPNLLRELEAALAFWQAAGVDCAFRDEPRAWLAKTPLPPTAPERGQPAPRPRPPQPKQLTAHPVARPRQGPATPAETAARRDFLGDSPPADLAAWRHWWLSAPGLAAARTYPRIPPRGNAGAALMVLVPQPEESDRDRLLEGPQGRLLARILSAMGLAEDAVYLAAALPCHTPQADLYALAAGGMDAVTQHHIALVAPQRLLVLGKGLGPMLGAGAAGDLREINHAGGKVPVMISETLEAMLSSPTLKARFWRRWVEWSASL